MCAILSKSGMVVLIALCSMAMDMIHQLKITNTKEKAETCAGIHLNESPMTHNNQ